MSQRQEIKKKLIFHFNWRLTLSVIILFPTLISLGFWQLDRAHEKEQLLKSHQLKVNQNPLPIEQLNSLDSDSMRYQQVKLSGKFLPEKQILIDNQIYRGKFGYEVITPLKLATNEVVLVSRGWVSGDLDRSKLPKIETPDVSLNLLGEIYVAPGKPMLLGEYLIQQNWPIRVPYIDIEKLKPLFAEPLFPFLVRLHEDQPSFFEKHWVVINIQPEKHIGYAVQWFVMAATLVLLYLLASTNIVSLVRKNKI